VAETALALITPTESHTHQTSDFDKDNPQLVAETALALITPTESQGVWRNVEKKKGLEKG